jgi:hypothetical protein
VHLVKRGTLALVLLMSSSCSHRWPNQWFSIHKRWQPEFGPVSGADSGLMFHGGYRFGELNGMLVMDLPSVEVVNVPPDTLVEVQWVADASACHGFAFKLGSGRVRFLLAISRLTLRQAIGGGVALLMEDANHRVIGAIQPSLTGFDLDTWALVPFPFDGRYATCVSAEQRVLALAELKRIASDRDARRIDDASAMQLQDQLSPMLSSHGRLCGK